MHFNKITNEIVTERSVPKMRGKYDFISWFVISECVLNINVNEIT